MPARKSGYLKNLVPVLVPGYGCTLCRGRRLYLVPASCARGYRRFLCHPIWTPRGPIWPIYSCAGPCAGPCAIPVPNSRTQTQNRRRPLCRTFCAVLVPRPVPPRCPQGWAQVCSLWPSRRPGPGTRTGTRNEFWRTPILCLI